MIDRQHRRTGLTVAAVLAAAACWNVYRGRMTVVAVLGGLAFLLTISSLFIPAAARAFHVGWMRFAQALGAFNSRILMTLAFFGIITPAGLVMRILGHDPLSMRKPAKDTFWVERKTTRQTAEGFEKAF